MTGTVIVIIGIAVVVIDVAVAVAVAVIYIAHFHNPMHISESDVIIGRSFQGSVHLLLIATTRTTTVVRCCSGRSRRSHGIGTMTRTSAAFVIIVRGSICISSIVVVVR